MIPRAGWGAANPRNWTPIGAVYGVALHWNGPGMGHTPHSRCAGRVRGVQQFHMVKRGWSDVAYSWAVCPHGESYELRGWGIRTAANGTNYGNDHYHAIVYLGGEGDAFTDEAKAEINALIRQHDERYPTRVVAHSQLKPTACPGPEIERWIKDGRPVSFTVTAVGDDDDMITRASERQAVRLWQRDINSVRRLRLNKEPIVEDGLYGPSTEEAWKEVCAEVLNVYNWQAGYTFWQQDIIRQIEAAA